MTLVEQLAAFVVRELKSVDLCVPGCDRFSVLKSCPFLTVNHERVGATVQVGLNVGTVDFPGVTSHSRLRSWRIALPCIRRETQL